MTGTQDCVIPKCDLWGAYAALAHTIFSMESFVCFGHSSSHLMLRGEDHSRLVNPNDSFIKWSLWHVQKTFPEVQYLEGTKQ